MKPSRGYYSLIQYCPDPGRLEAASIGVLVYCPDMNYLKAKTTSNNRRIIRFFGAKGHDWKRINAFKKGLEDRIQVETGQIKSLADLEQFIAQRANLLQITPPRPMRIDDPEKDLNNLFVDLIDQSKQSTSTRGLRRVLGERLDQAGLTPKLRRDITVQVPILHKQLEIPFGYRSGRFNLIIPVPFEAANPDFALRTACTYAVEGRSLFKNPDPALGDLTLVVVGQFPSRDHVLSSRVKEVFEDHHVQLYRFTDLPMLIDDIRRNGQVLAV